MIVKLHDTHTVEWVASAPLGPGDGVRLLASEKYGDVHELPVTVSDAGAGVVSHQLTGTLPVGTYRVELEVTRDGIVTTFPNAGYAELKVIPDLG